MSTQVETQPPTNGVAAARTASVARRSARLLIVPAAVLLSWWLLSAVVGPVAVADPAAALAAAAEGFSEGWLATSLLETLLATGLGFLLATTAGLWLGFTLGMSRFWGEVLEGPLLWLYSIPKVTLFPLFLLFLGLGLSSTVLFGAFHGIFPLALFLMAAIRGIPSVLLQTGRVYRLNRRQIFTRIVVPETLPAMVMGIRYCFSLTFLGVILAEMFAARAGAGYELMKAISLNNVARIFAVAITLVIVALIVNVALLGVQGVVNRRRGGTLDDTTPR
jgi:NitT/TauT family transport system permease protein